MASSNKESAVKKKESVGVVEKFQKSNSGKKVPCVFIASPTGLLGLGYNIGEEASFTEGQVTLLEDLKLAERLK